MNKCIGCGSILQDTIENKDGYVLDTTSWGAGNIKTDADGSYVELTWKVVAKDLKNTTVTVDKDGKDIIVNIFLKEETQDLYQKWLDHTLE